MFRHGHELWRKKTCKCNRISNIIPLADFPCFFCLFVFFKSFRRHNVAFHKYFLIISKKLSALSILLCKERPFICRLVCTNWSWGNRNYSAFSGRNFVRKTYWSRPKCSEWNWESDCRSLFYLLYRIPTTLYVLGCQCIYKFVTWHNLLYFVFLQRENGGVVMVNFYDKYINCPPNNETIATLSQVAG